MNWHDLAFYDSALFESLRKLVVSAQTDPDSVEEMDLTFEIDDSTVDEGATQLIALIPNGSSVKVTRQNIYNYVRRYAHYKMVTKIQPAVKELKRGVYDVISEQSLNGLTPEDWWLLGMMSNCTFGNFCNTFVLVNGVGTVDVAKLSGITTFNDESNSKDEGDKSDVQRLQKWFWEVVETFSQNERQELLYFWTGLTGHRRIEC